MLNDNTMWVYFNVICRCRHQTNFIISFEICCTHIEEEQNENRVQDDNENKSIKDTKAENNTPAVTANVL